MNRNMIKQAQQMQAKLAQIQEEVANTKTEATSGGGVVKAVVIGTSKIEVISESSKTSAGNFKT